MGLRMPFEIELCTAKKRLIVNIFSRLTSRRERQNERRNSSTGSRSSNGINQLATAPGNDGQHRQWAGSTRIAAARSAGLDRSSEQTRIVRRLPGLSRFDRANGDECRSVGALLSRVSHATAVGRAGTRSRSRMADSGRIAAETESQVQRVGGGLSLSARGTGERRLLRPDRDGLRRFVLYDWRRFGKRDRCFAANESAARDLSQLDRHWADRQ